MRLYFTKGVDKLKTNILRCAALAIGLSAGTVSAQYGAYAPNGFTGAAAPQQTMPIHPSFAAAQQQTQPVGLARPPQAMLNQPVGYGQPGTAYAQPVAPYRQANVYTQPANNGFAPQQLPSAPRVAMNNDQLLPSPATGNVPPMPTPASQSMPQVQYSGEQYSSNQYAPTQYPAAQNTTQYPSAQGCSSCNNGQQSYGPTYAEPTQSYASPYAQAVISPNSSESCGTCAPVMMPGPVPVRSCFGGAGVMFLDVVDKCDTRLVFDVGAPAQTRLSTGDAQISSATGGSFFIGRYFGCGRYAVVANYWALNPSSSSASTQAPAAGAFNAEMPMPNNYAFIDLNNNGTFENVAPVYEGVGTIFDRATAYRIQRDMDFQNVEVSVIGFGLGGAGRMGVAGCGNGCGGIGAALKNEFGNNCGNNCNSCNSCNSCNTCPGPGCAGGPCGPIMPGCGCRLRTTYGHGIRWFRFNDSFEFAASTAVPGYGPTNDDIYYNINVKNDLIGYQFTGRLDYCLCKQFSMYAGGKAGIYVNDVQFRSSLGGGATAAVVEPISYPTMANQPLLISSSDTSLATLAELDLGLTYTVNPCWSFNGGYRILGISGVATATGQIASDAANLTEAGQICADKSLILHGAYIGGTYNY